MADILDRPNRHLFLEDSDNTSNSFIANVNEIADRKAQLDIVAADIENINTVGTHIDNVDTVAENIQDISDAVDNISTVKTFNDNVNNGTMQYLLEAFTESLDEEGNAWVVRLTRLGESIVASTSAFNYSTVVTVTTPIASGGTLTLPSPMKYKVGTHMLMVSWNGTVCYAGDQYDEVGAYGVWSTTITLNHELRTGDKVQFRIVALTDASTFVDITETALNSAEVLATGSITGRTLPTRFSDITNVKDFGAKGNGVTDDTAAFVAALNNHSSIYVPDGQYKILFEENNVEYLSDIVSSVQGTGTVNISIGAGVFTSNKSIKMSGNEIASLNLTGKISDELSITSASVESDTFSATHWDGVTKDLNYNLITFTLSSTVPSDVTEGMVVAVYDVVGDDSFVGCWEITSINGSQITALTMSNSAPSSFTSAKAKIVKSVIKVLGISESNPKGVEGFRIENTSNVTLDNIAFVGAGRAVASSDGRGPDKFDCPGGYGGVQGIVTSRSGLLMLGNYFCVSGFSGSNIALNSVGGVFKGFSSGAARNGIGIGFGASEQCYNSICSGNLIDGYVIQDNSSALIQGAISSGNYRHGFIITAGSDLNSQGCKANLNGGDGVSATACAVRYASGESIGNTQRGVYAVNASSIACSGIKCQSNSEGGILAVQQSYITATSSPNCINNTDFDFKALTGSTVMCNGKSSSAVTVPVIDKIGPDLANCIAASSKDYLGFTGNKTTEAARFTDTNTFLLGMISKFTGTGPGGCRFQCSGGGAFKGGLFPSEDNTYNIGNTSFRWATIFAGTGTISTSDERCKTNIECFSDAVLRAWGKVNFKVFQFIDAVSEKGVNARLHTGIVAQDVARAFESEGLDASRYGLFCYDKWEEERDVDGNIIQKAGDRYGIRYDEALALECAYQRDRTTKTESRISDLESTVSNLQEHIAILEARLASLEANR